MSANRPDRRDEDGLAMIVVMIVSSVALLLVTMMLAQGLHVLEATSYDRRWNRALQAAEAGLEERIAALQKNADDLSPLNNTSEFGEFEVVVTAPTSSTRLISSKGWSPSKTAPLARLRKIEVLYAPEPTFRYALFSNSTLDLKNQNNNCTEGDVYATATITIDKACVKGSVTSARGAIIFANDAEIKKRTDPDTGQLVGGDVHSGGLVAPPAGMNEGIRLTTGVNIYGEAHARQPSCPSTDNTNYTISGDNQNRTGTIHGDAFGPAIFANVLGQRNAPFCEISPAVETLPAFREDQVTSVYPGIDTANSAQSMSSVLAAMGNNISGKFYVNDPNGTIVFPNNATVTSTFVLVTNAAMSIPNSFDVRVTDGDTEFVNLISLNTSVDPNRPAIKIVNSFNVHPAADGVVPAVLVYAAGLIDVKNTANSNGAIYGARLTVQNNLNISYDPRLLRVPGFGVDYRLVRVTWKETTGRA